MVAQYRPDNNLYWNMTREEMDDKADRHFREQLAQEEDDDQSDKLSRSNRCYLSMTVGLISQNNLRMVNAVTVGIINQTLRDAINSYHQ